MNFFQAAAAVFGAAQRVASPQRPSSSTRVPEHECTPCAADAYASQLAQQTREMFGTAQKSKKSRSRR